MHAVRPDIALLTIIKEDYFSLATTEYNSCIQTGRSASNDDYIN